MSEDITHLNDATFDTTVESSPRLVVDFWAPWCGPCKMLAPTYEALAKSYKGKVVFAKLDTDQSPRTAMALGINSIPTLIFYKDGKQIDRLIGARPRGDIENSIKKLLV